ncbi:MAG: peptidyl-prolyl cis-trans isomerase [Burkholderiales bacterium]|nr:peptidyl-prolyl cis-trans isomerase [Burkholderiales bacterium]
MNQDESLTLAGVRDLLLARADELGVEAPDGPDGVIERLLAREIRVPESDDDACRRFYDANPHRFVVDQWVDAAHILFAVTPGAHVQALIRQAERTLASLQAEPAEFGRCAQEFSNCPSGQKGGDIGRLRRGDSVPEFEQALFTQGPLGVLPELVRTRYGMHIVRVDRREAGRPVPLEAVLERIRTELAGASWEAAARQYVAWLQRRSEVPRGAVVSPLVQ